MKRFSSKCRILFFLAATVATCSLLMSNRPQTKAVKAIASNYASELQALEKAMLQMEASAESATIDQLRNSFVEARVAYKKIEWLIEYHFPATAIKINGPALPEAEPSEPAEALHPSGFQVLEEKLYNEEAGQLRKEIVFEISSIVNRIHHLQALAPEMELTESNIFDAVRLHLYRIITKGITGFDSPVAENSIAELQPSLVGIKTALAFFLEPKPLLQKIDAAMAYARQGRNDFNSFNRAVFIAQYLNPVCTALNSYQQKQKIPYTQEERALRPDARTLFEASAWQPLFYAPSGTGKATPIQIALGKKLFAEPLLSANGKRSCASCHHPEKAFTDGLALNITLSGSGTLLRNTPTLYNASLQSAQFYDSRISFLEDQIHDVISNQQEMNGQFTSIVKSLEKKKSYKQLFRAAFADKNISADNIRAAVAAYVRDLVFLNSPFDRYMQGNQNAMSAEQVAGFNLFAGKGKCATCHFVPLFSGNVPPLFDKMESEVLGVPAHKDSIGSRVDADSGKYALYKIPHHLFSFKTPSLRNVTLTSPYMHNGVFSTLDEVLDFYNRGGGAGLGIDLPNQTLPGEKLGLTFLEKKQIISFLHALEDRGKR